MGEKIELFFFFFFTGPAYEMMKKCDLRETSNQLFKYFPTIHDAVHHAMNNITPISVITENGDTRK